MIRTMLSTLCFFLIAINFSWGQIQESSPQIYSMDECIQLAEKHNATLIAAKQSYNVAKSDVWTAWGRLLPGVNSSLGYSRNIYGPTEGVILDPDADSLIFGLSGIQVSKGYSASISASQSWSLGGYDFYSIKEKKASRNSAENSYQLTRQELILAVKQAYFDVLKAKMLLEIQKEAMKRANEQLKIAETRYELGAASFSDVLKAKVLYGDVKLALISADNTLKLAKAALNSWMGQNVDSPLDVEENLTVSEFDYSYQNALDESMRKNPNVRKAQSDLSSARAQLGMARSGYFPNFNISGSYSWSHEDLEELKHIRTRDYNWRLSASISFNIFENFQTKHNFSYAKANRKSAEENFQQTKRDVALELKQAFLNVQQAEQKIELTKEKLKSAKEDLDLAQEKYNLGAASILDLLDAEVSYKQAESDQVEALYDYNLAVAQFEKTMGK
jgi:outer membrane protein